MSSLFVTGARGFLGRAVCRFARERGWRVRGLVRGPSSELESLGVEVLEGDLLDRDVLVEGCRGCEHVVHAAAIAGIWGRRSEFFQVNVVGTRNVIEACRAAGVRCLVYTSSPSVTFDGRPQEGVDESEPYPDRWLCAYPWSKALAEREVLAAHDGGGLATCALRPHLIWGPGDPHLVPRLVARARAGRLRRVGDGSNRVDTIYVDNAALAHLQALDALAAGKAGGQPFFLSQGEPVNCWDWIDALLDLHGLPPVRRSISFRAAWRAGAVLEAVWRCTRRQSEPVMTRFLAAQLAHSHWFCLDRARDALGFRAAVSHQEGMRRLAAAVRQTTPETAA